MQDATRVDSSEVLAPVAVAGPVFPVAFLLVVLAPAIFWSAVTFLVAFLAGFGGAAQHALVVFTFATAFLTFIALLIRVRI